MTKVQSHMGQHYKWKVGYQKAKVICLCTVNASILDVTTPMLTTTTTQGSILVVTESSTTKSPRVKSIEIDDITPPSTESTPNNDALNKTGNGKDVKSEKVVISTEDIKTILIGLSNGILFRFGNIVYISFEFQHQ